MDKNIFLSVVIPCYNEAKNIPLLLERFKNIIQDQSTEVILVNNGSKDDTETILSALAPRFPFLRIIKVNHNQGYGFGILQGLKEARGEFIGWTHADLQTDPSDLLKAQTIIFQGNRSSNLYVKGRRQNRPWQDVIFTYGMTLFEWLYLRRWLFDINAQPNIFHRSFFKKWENPPHDFSLDLYCFYMARKNGLKTIRFDVQFPKRLHGQSSWNTGLKSKWKFIKRTLDFSYKLKKEFKKDGVLSPQSL